MQYIDVVIDNKSVNTDSFYTYKAPDEVFVGAKLTVPFARRKKASMHTVLIQVLTALWMILRSRRSIHSILKGLLTQRWFRRPCGCAGATE